MKCFYIITNPLKDPSKTVEKRLVTLIKAGGGRCVTQGDSGDISDPYSDDTGRTQEFELSGVDCALVIGGDGTLIRAARELVDRQIPILGINRGTLGYLTEVEEKSVDGALARLFSGEYVIEERMMLTGKINGKRCDRALNDIVLARAGALRVIHFSIYVNGSLLSHYVADGVILSTPTGTTGYNLSAGGPVVEPTAQMIVITPICSHDLYASSIVLSAEDTVEVCVDEGKDGQPEEVCLSFDGTAGIPMRTGDVVTVSKADQKTKLVKLTTESFLRTMRKKMKGK